MPVRNALLDSSRWDRLEFREDDIVVASWPKSGTTWLQQIVAQLVFDGAPDVFGQALSPWIECRFIPALRMAAMQTHRRILKTHLPAGSVPLVSQARYLFVARDPRDAFWSWHRHQAGMSDATFELMNRTPGRNGCEVRRLDPDVAIAFEEWLERDDAFVGPYWPNLQSWWEVRQRPNVLLLHYGRMSTDLESEVTRITEFLEIAPAREALANILQHCSLDHMRGLAARNRALGWIFDSDGGHLIHLGGSGRWQSSLSRKSSVRLFELAGQRLSADCASWLFAAGATTGDQTRSIDAAPPEIEMPSKMDG